MRGKSSNLFKLMAIFVIAVAAISGFYLVGRSQFLSTKALTPASLGSVTTQVFDPQNGITKVDVTFKTGINSDETETVSTIAFRLSASSKSGQKLQLVDKDGNNTQNISIGENSLEKNDWLYPVDRLEEKDNGLLIDFSAVNKSKSGYSNSVPENLATFYLKGVDNKNNLNLSFDKDLSAMYSKRRPVTNIWEIK